MLTATASFVSKVGTAPSTTTIALGGVPGLGTACLPVPTRQEAIAEQSRRPPIDEWRRKDPARRFYVPYNTKPYNFPTSANEWSTGLGVINQTDAWLTGRPYGLPGTTALRMWPDATGKYHSELVGSGLGAGEADTTELLRQLIDVQHKQEHALNRTAFWTATVGAVILAGMISGAIVDAYFIAKAYREHRPRHAHAGMAGSRRLRRHRLYMRGEAY